jgi:hypothetical protein
VSRLLLCLCKLSLSTGHITTVVSVYVLLALLAPRYHCMLIFYHCMPLYTTACSTYTTACFSIPLHAPLILLHATLFHCMQYTLHAPLKYTTACSSILCMLLYSIPLHAPLYYCMLLYSIPLHAPPYHCIGDHSLFQLYVATFTPSHPLILSWSNQG